MKRFISVIALIFLTIAVCNAQIYDFGDYKIYHSTNSTDTVICGACNYTGNCFGWYRFKKKSRLPKLGIIINVPTVEQYMQYADIYIGAIVVHI